MYVQSVHFLTSTKFLLKFLPYGATKMGDIESDLQQIGIRRKKVMEET